MIKHNRIRTTKSKKKIERNKTFFDNSYKSGLFVVASSALFFSLLIIGFVIFKGLDAVISNDNIWNNGGWLFGSTYDGLVLFSAGFMVINTLWTSLIAAIIAVPISILTALFITRVAPKSLKPLFFVILSILAAIPSVIYGAFGSKALDSLFMIIFNISSGTMLSIVVTLAFMIMPTITLITAASINAVDKRMEDSSLALGATRNQTSFHVTIKAASTGIMTAVILGLGRALGEATAVSMISMDPYYGPTFGLFEQIRLLTATMLKGYNEIGEDTIQEASVFAMGMILIITILGVFLSLRILQKINNEESKSKKSYKKISGVRKIKEDVEEYGLENISISQQKKYNELLKKKEINEQLDFYYSKQYEKQIQINRTTISTTFEKQKAKKDKILGGITWITAFIGLIFLASIILFLLILGVDSLSWEYISTNNEIIGEERIKGIQSSIFGTVLLIVLSMIFIIPLGVGTGIYFSTFSKDNKLNRSLMIGIDILSGVPSLIFGLVGAAIFLPIANNLGFVPIAGAIILTLIIIPTVVQTTNEAIKSVPKEIVSGSLALGSTKASSSIRISLPQAMPQIMGGLILSIGRIIGESAAIVMIFGTTQRGDNSDWMVNGGTTLATEMYRLTLSETINWNYVATIGLVIVSLILVLSLLSNYISNKDKIGIIGVIISIILLLSGIFQSGKIGLVIFIVGIGILGLTIIITIITNLSVWRRK